MVIFLKQAKLKKNTFHSKLIKPLKLKLTKLLRSAVYSLTFGEMPFVKIYLKYNHCVKSVRIRSYSGP